MPVLLGPLPDTLREWVRHRFERCRREEPSQVEESLAAVFLVGGPGGCLYLDAAGEVWDWDDAPARVPDGLDKVRYIRVAADRFPELAAWLPARPAGAVECGDCGGSSWWRFRPQLRCPSCGGLGWQFPEQRHAEPGAASDGGA